MAMETFSYNQVGSSVLSNQTNAFQTAASLPKPFSDHWTSIKEQYI